MPAPTGQEVLTHGGPALKSAITGRRGHRAAAALPSAGLAAALLDAYQAGFSATLDHLMMIGAVIALVGSICAFALVRERDFVPSVPHPPRGAPEQPEAVAPA